MSEDLIQPDYWDEACTALMKQDRILRKLIPKLKDHGITSRGDPFLTLARSIIGQQISVTAAQTVWHRFAALTPKVTAKNILALDHELMRSAGLSIRKVEYLKDLADHFQNKGLNKVKWHLQEDEAVIKELTAIRGIGRWTAEMAMIFRLGRLDVWPVGDLAVRKGWSRIYDLSIVPSEKDFEHLADHLKPYRSVVAWYCWRATDETTQIW
jgi:DNA-3-methyladenine glycosylase II